MATDSTDDEIVDDSLPVILSQQITPDTPVRCIGLAQGTRNGMNYTDTFNAARKAMYAEVRAMGGQVIIDPEMSEPLRLGNDSGKIVYMVRCRVGVFTEDEAQGRSQ